MTAPNRAARRAQEREQSIRNRRIRHLAIRTAAALAEGDETVSGFTLIAADGSLQYIDADTLRRGGAMQ